MIHQAQGLNLCRVRLHNPNFPQEGKAMTGAQVVLQASYGGGKVPFRLGKRHVTHVDIAAQSGAVKKEVRKAGVAVDKDRAGAAEGPVGGTRRVNAPDCRREPRDNLPRR